MKKCTQCGQTHSDDTNFCFKCGGSAFEAVEETTGTYQPPQQAAPEQPQQSYYAQQPAQEPQQKPQQSYYAQPTQPVKTYQQPPAQSYQQPVYQQPSYQQPANNEPVSVGMWILFFIVSAIPLVGLIFNIIVAVSSGFKKSYVNAAKAWIILTIIGFVLGIIITISMWSFFVSFFDAYGSSYGYY